jgi:phosphotransferase system enzyme I (PtsP)
VGSNDLVQFLFAADRGNAQVANRFDPLSPPALRVLKLIADTCKKHDKPFTLCGELAAKPLEAMTLIALGFRSLSLSPAMIGPVKAMVLALDASEAEKAVLPLLQAGGSGREKLQAFAAAAGIPV